jgi:hypothetical protein
LKGCQEKKTETLHMRYRPYGWQEACFKDNTFIRFLLNFLLKML